MNYTQDPIEMTATLPITAEGQVGHWELRFYSDINNESIVGKIPFYVEGDSYDPITLELDKTVVSEGDTLNVKFEFDRRHQVATPRILYYTKATPSIFHITSFYDLNTYMHTQSVPVLIETHGACGWHEMRCFTSDESYTPCLRVHFYVNVPNPVKLRCHPLNVKDGGTIDVDWDIPPNAYIEFYLCFYPKDNLVEENGFTFTLSERKGSTRVQIESGQKSTGAWEVRLVEKYTMLVMAVAPFTLIGAKEAFSFKMLGNVKFIDAVFID